VHNRKQLLHCCGLLEIKMHQTLMKARKWKINLDNKAIDKNKEGKVEL
jgi:hypothetical protein